MQSTPRSAQPSAIEDFYALSPMQEGMLFHVLRDEGSDVYFNQYTFTLRGTLDEDAFRRAWEMVLARHPVMRTAFAWEKVEKPLQVVRRTVALPWEVLDWRDGEPGTEHARLEAFLRADRERGFQVARPPLMRVTLVRASARTWHFVWSHHHLLLDAWSGPLLLGEVFGCYRALLAGTAPQLAARRPFKDYVAWLERQSLVAAEAFWRRALAGFSSPTPIPAGRATPVAAAEDEETRSVRASLSAASSAALRSLARQHRLTLSTVVQGAWGLLLSRYSGSADVVFGSTVSGRPVDLPGADEMIGLFINTLPVRVACDPAEGVLPWLRRLQATQTELREYEFSPLAQVQRWSEVPAGQPLFNSILIVNAPQQAGMLGDLGAVAVEGTRVFEKTNYPLTLEALTDGRVAVVAEYQVEHYDHAGVERMLGHLRVLLEAIAADPARTLGELPMLDAAESAALSAWSSAPAPAPAATLPELFARQAAATPDAPAVVSASGVLTYAELNARANQLARHLRGLGVGPEVRVGLFLERGPEMAVAILGVLKAGGAYVPLDPGLPADRVAFLLADTAAPVVLTQDRVRHLLPEFGGSVLALDAEWDRVVGEVDTDPNWEISPRSLAYAIYTSGSTGTPKGALIEHHSLAAYAVEMAGRLGFGPGDRMLQFAAFSFDVVVEELFPAWVSGAAVVLHEDDLLAAPEELVRVLARHGVTGVELPTAYWHEWVRALAQDEIRLPECLRFVIIGGEKVSPERMAEWAGFGVPLIHVFGLTETTCTNTTLHLDAGDDGARWLNLPVGRPIGHNEVRVLDAELRPVPIGVPGELYIGGALVGRGYLNRPALTAERYVPDPFSGGRMYRTGDRARWLADGTVEFLGRTDHQVKIRGFRIEPGEVEGALLAHPAVGEAVVVARKSAGGAMQLVGYVTPAGDEAPDAEALRAFVAGRLPSHMVPAALAVLPALPLTRHGKLDRAALPDVTRAATPEEFTAPDTGAESTLAAIWSAVLGVEQVGAHDDFFALGGDSILSIQIVSRAKREGIQLTPRQLFEHPTVAGLARVAGSAPRVKAEQGAVTGPVPLTPVQRWFFQQEVPERHRWNLPVVLETAAPMDSVALEDAVRALLSHHDALRMRYAPDGTQQVAGVEAAVPFARHDLSALDDAAQAAELARLGEAAQASLHLERGPLLRVVCFHRGGGRGDWLLLVPHHLVADGVSLRILVEDLGAAYEQARRGERPRFAAKTTSFKHWAERLAAHAASGGFSGELPHWRGLGDAPALPVDFAGGSNTGADARTVEVTLTRDETETLLAGVPAVYRTQVNDALLAALARALCAWTGTDQALVELEGHGREEIFDDVDLSRTVGWFTTVFPVLLDLRGAAGEGAALRAVRDGLRAVPGRGLGFGALRWLAGDETLAARPQVAFNYMGQVDAGGDGAFSLTALPAGDAVAPTAPRAHPVEVEAEVSGGCLRVRWIYSAALHRRETIEHAAGAMAASLRALLEGARAGIPSYAPSDFLLAGADQAALDRVAARYGTVEDVLPLAPMQEGMLFHTLYEPAAGMYVGQMSFQLHGELDEAAFEGAWRAVAARHGSLRTAFLWQGLERPLQVVLPAAPVALETEDLRGVDADAAIRRYLAEDRARGFDLAAPPLMRLRLFRTGEGEHLLVWTHHQMLLDGWSIPVVFGEVVAHYDAAVRGTRPALAAARPYRDYLEWLAGRDRDASEAFWRRALEGFQAPTPFGIDRPAPQGPPEGDPGEVKLHLPAAATAALEALARREGLTMNTVVQGAWALVLSRYSGSSDVVFGATASGRPAALEGIEHTVGLFINTLPVRVDANPAARVLPWLRALQDAQQEAREHEATPLADIQRWSEVPAGLPLFESFLVFQNYPVEAALKERTAEPRIRYLESAEKGNIPIALVAVPGERLLLDAAFDTRRFHAAQVERMMGHLAAALESFAAHPAGRLHEVQILAAEERELLAAWNRTEAPSPAGATLPALFERQAGLTPHAPAVVFGGETLSYAELDARANRLARHLRARGVGPERLVGICLERGTDLAVAFLAVMKAGGAYLPVDPGLPAERIAFLLADSDAAAVVTRAYLVEKLPAEYAGAVVALDAERAAIDAEDGDPLAPLAGARNLAYAIHTSGSTGTPKGSLVEHHSLCHYALDMAARLGMGPGDRILQFAALSFDVVVEEVFPAWVSGAAVVLHDGDLLAAPAELLRVVEAQGVTGFELPTAYWHEWVSALAADGRRLPPCVRFVIIGGEKVSPERLREWAALEVPLVHVFGLTETTCTSSTLHLPAGDDGSRWSNLPIGRPVGNTTLHVLDASLAPAPIGVPGELYIGGALVGRGYLNRPALTAERFVPDPFSGGRMYRTGDRARWLEDGTVEFLGRTDHQVKIRGFRIEPGEVEGALLAHPAVGEAVVVARKTAGGVLQLVGYVTPAGDEAPDAEALRAFVAERLPAHMVPAAVAVLPALPLTRHGKLDRAALPDVTRAPSAGEEFVAPRDGIESTLAGIWSAVLGVERVGAHDDFFALGGDSILSIQVVARAHREGIQLTPRQLFEHPTVARLARVAGSAPRAVAEQGVVTGPVQLTPVQHWFFEQDLPDPRRFTEPLLLEVPAGTDAAHVAEAVRLLVAHHDALRLRFRADGRQENAAPGATPFRHEDLSGLPEADRAHALRVRVRAAHDEISLHDGLFRAVLFGMGADRPGRLLIVVHHLAIDAVSWRVLLEDLESAWTALERGEKPAFAPKTTSFRDWAARLAAHAAAGGFDAELAYWTERAAAPALPVDFDASEADNTEGSGRIVSTALSAADTEALLSEVPSVYRTQVNDALLAALGRALERWTGSGVALLEMEGHGREEIFADVDLSRTVGWFTTLFPVLLDLRGARGEGDALKAAKEQLRALPNRGLGYGALRYLGSPEARAALAALPRPQVAFEYMGRLDGAVSGPLRRAAEPAGEAHDPRAPRRHLLEVSAGVQDGRLQVAWVYSEAFHRRETVEALAASLLDELRALVEHCRQPGAGGYTPSDFPLARLAQHELDALLGAERDVEDVYPLAPMQAGMLFHTLYDDAGAGAYLGQFAFTVEGRLDPGAFRRAWDAVVARHSALRAGFVWEGVEAPLQVVRARVRVPVEAHDWRQLSEAARDEAMRAFLAADRARGMELASAPLMRVSVFRTGEEAHRVVWTHHQMTLDGWSLPLLFQELLEAYEALAAGGAPRLAAAPQYREYVAWLAGRELGAAEAFWRDALAGFTVPNTFGIEGDAGRGNAAATARMSLSHEATEALRAFARGHGLTLNTVVQGAWVLLLARYGSTGDVVFGATVSGRPAELEGVEGIVGNFLNTLPVRVRVPRGATVLHWLTEMQAGQARMREHEHAPLADIQAWSEVPRGMPLFDSFLVFQNYPIDRALAEAESSLRIRVEHPEEESNYALALGVIPEPTLAFDLAYDEHRFAPAAIERMLGHLRALLEEMPLDAARTLDELPMLDAEEAAALAAWSSAPAPAPSATLPELFARQAAATPDAPAVISGSGTLSYAELNARANQLARHLRGLGVGPEVRVGLFLERGPEMAIAILGVLKAGGAYVPLDPGLPADRVAFLLSDTSAPVVLTQHRVRHLLPEAAGSVLALDAEWDRVAGEADTDPNWEIGPRTLAYAIYTSGSTGTPKGALIEHHSLAAYAVEMAGRLGFGPGDRMLQFAAFSFDVVVEELFPAWVSGAAVVLHEGDLLAAPEELVRVLARHGVTGVELPTAYWHEWVRALSQDGVRLPECLRFVIIGGEKVSPERMAEWAGMRVPLIHVFGLTETTCTSTTLHLPAGDDGSAWRNLPIGRPIGHNEVRVLDASLAPAPIGVPGELYIGGALVGRGYLNRPGLTAEKFVPDPFAGEGARMYRTGDRARWLQDGTIEFLGRIDHQVKIRGFRIEPGEVEAALQAHPGVREAVVALHSGASGAARLVGYVVPGEGWAFEHGGLREKRVEIWPSHGEYPVYDDHLYRAMAEDHHRNEGYREALAAVMPGKVAVDVGTGGEAVLARLCIEAGARKVYAIEVMEESFRQAEARVRELGLEDRIILIHGDATTVELPEPVDVCISELIGCIGGSEGAVAILNQARRWLKPDGVMIPARCVTRVAGVSLPDALHAEPAFEELGAHYAERVFEAIGHRDDVRLCVKGLSDREMLTDEAVFEELDFSRHGETTTQRDIELAVTRGGRLDGLALWIEFYPGERRALDSLRQECAFLPMLFPAFYPGLQVAEGDVLRMRAITSPAEAGTYPDYRVEGVLERADGTRTPFAYESLHRRPPAAPNALHRRLVGGRAGEVRTRERAGRVALDGYLRGTLPEYMVPSVFMGLDALPLTRHGKVDRRALPAPEAPARDEELHVAPAEGVEAKLAAIWSAVLGVERVGAHDDFFALGGDSILSIQIVSRAKREGIQLTPRHLFEHPTVARLARVAGTAPRVRAEQGAVTGPVPLTPVQHWFFQREVPAPHHWNMPVLLEVAGPMDAGALEAAVAALLAHHDALRMRYAPGIDGWAQESAAPDANVPFVHHDLTGLDDAAQEAALARLGGEAQASLSLRDGPVVRVAYFHRGGGRGDWLLLTPHHLVADGVSLRVLLEDLGAAYEQARRGEPVRLAPKTTSFREWAERLAAHTAGGGFGAELPFWLDAAREQVPALPVDFPGGGNTEDDAGSLTVRLDRETTEALLTEVPPVYRTQVNDALMAALARALCAWTGSELALVELEGHGREEIFADVDLSRTVGWFTTLFPVLVDLRGAEGPSGALRAAKEQLRAVPGRGLGHGALRWLAGDDTRARMAALPEPQVSLNYMGQVDAGGTEAGPFALSPLAHGADQAPGGRRAHLLEVEAQTSGGRLELVWSYSRALHRRETVERLAAAMLGELAAIVEHCRTARPGFTPSDFPLARIGQAQLDALAAEYPDVEDVYPLSAMHLGMLFHTLEAPGSGVYCAQYTFELSGALHAAAFTRAWRDAAARHAALRTAFAWERLDEPLQVVCAAAGLPVEEADWSGLDAEAREGRLREYLAADRARGFDPARAPLLRLGLFRAAGDEHLLVLSFHQMVMDGWSLPVLFVEVMALYEAYSGGAAPALEPARPYRDYAAWLRGRDLGEAEAYWRETLRGITAPTPLGVDRPAAPGDDAHAGHSDTHLALPAPLTAALHDLARRAGVTANTLVQGAWALLLARYSGESDVVFGATVSGRPAELEGVEGMVGLFINTLPVRLSADPGQELLPWLRRLQESQARMRDFEFTPLSQVQGWSDVPRGQPLFESMLVFENYPVDEALGEQRGTLAVRTRGDAEQTNYPVTVTVMPGREMLLGLAYYPSRLDAAAAERMLVHLRTLLEGFVAAPGARLGQLALLPPPSARGWRPSGTTRTSRTRTCPRRCTRWWRHRCAAPPARWRWCSRARASPTRSWTRAQTGWRAASARWGWGWRRGWGWPWSAASSSWSRCWPCSRPGAPTCPWTPATRPTASPTCWKTPPFPSSSPRGAWPPACPRTPRTWCGWTRSGRRSSARAPSRWAWT